MVRLMRGEIKGNSVGQVFPVHRKGLPGVGVVGSGLGSPVSFPPHEEIKPVVLKKGSTAPWGSFGYDDWGICYSPSDSRLCSFPPALHLLLL